MKEIRKMNKMKSLYRNSKNGSFAKFFAVAVFCLTPFFGWGQTRDDYSGVYYIGTKDYNASTPNNNFYLCPTEGWCFYKPTNDFDGNGTTYPNPFLTTYKCKTNDYHSGDSRDAIWTIEKDPNSGYYYIKQTSTGRYLLSNGQIRTTTNPDRIRVHLEAVTGTPGTNALFDITPYSTYLTISPIELIDGEYYNTSGGHTGNHTDHKWLTINGGNYNQLDGNSAKKQGPTNYVNTGGIVGIYAQNDVNAPFYLEKAAAYPPIITNNFDGTISISVDPDDTGATIYYTTDGNDPTTSSSVYSTDITLTDAITVVKAIAKKSSDYFPSIVRTYNIPVCERPVISVSGTTATITCSTPNAIIHYALDDASTTPSTLYEGQFDTGGAEVIRAIATSLGYLQSAVAYYYPPIVAHSSDDITNLNGRYILADDFTSSAPIGDADHPFQGQIDGNYVPFSLNGHALIGVAEDAVIKNVVVSSVTYSGSGNVGAIVNTAKGGTKIYNCGVRDGSVSGGTNTGGLVGLIEAGSSVRVVNCYNFANVSGSSYAAGIVGKNEGTVSSDKTVGNVRIALCMMYGSVSGATNISPVYCGNHVGNVQNYTEYNFYLYSNQRDANGNKIEKIPYTVYNDQQAITEEEYLTRFPFHRHILNTHRELGAFFLFGASTSNDVNSIASDEISEIGHWVLKPDEADYPIVEPWLTNKTNTTPTYEHNNLPNTTEDYKGRLLTEMGDNGYLNVSISIDGHSHSAKLPITDMNTDRHDYTWGKVVLPFANEFEINTNYDRICTGWKITSVTKEGTAYSSYSATNYNFADRDNPQKDIYGGDNLFIFAQGGYYIVPYGVTAITIVANFANAIYLSDATYDVGFDTDYANRAGLGGNVYANTEGKFHGKTVYHDIKDALASTAMVAKNTPHEQAIVLVGNYHFPSTDNPNNDYLDSYKTKAFTLMSIDADNNQEPDYAFYSKSWLNRPKVPPMRIDFVALVPLGMAAHVKDSKYYPGLPIWNTRGWFEMTETSLCWANQFELGSSQFNLDATDGKKYNRLIINSGYFVQMVRASKTNSSSGSNGSCQKLVYSQIGGNTYIKEYYPGSHSATPKTTTLVPVNVTGGEIEQCFMTGYGYSENAQGVGNYGTVIGDNIYFWCAGGKIGKFLGAYMEKPIPATTGGKVNMTALIDHALITEFYGGGTSPEAPITGKIDVTIKNSRVDRYCGGPEFGDMTPDETVTTRATNTTFGYFYGAGFGGTGITYYTYEDLTMDIKTPSNTVTTTDYPDYFFARHYSSTSSDHGRLKVKNGGIGTCYKFEYIVNTSVLDKLVARFYVGFAKFDLATTGDVTNTLTDCTVLYDFYGGGCQGKVDGTVTSTLTNCTVFGNAYGAGYKATANDVKVYTTTDPKTLPNGLSKFTMATGIFSEFHIPDPEIFQWKPGTAGTSSDPNKELYTDKPMNTLGDVTGDIKITLDGNTTVRGSVFGGGNESKALSNTLVEILEQTKVFGNIYGGGNMGEVGGNTKVVVNGQIYNSGQGTGSGNDPTND